MNLFTRSMLFYYFGKYLQVKNHKKTWKKFQIKTSKNDFCCNLFDFNILSLQTYQIQGTAWFQREIFLFVFCTIENQTEKRDGLQLKMQLNQVSSQILVVKLRNQYYEDGVSNSWWDCQIQNLVKFSWNQFSSGHKISNLRNFGNKNAILRQPFAQSRYRYQGWLSFHVYESFSSSESELQTIRKLKINPAEVKN